MPQGAQGAQQHSRLLAPAAWAACAAQGSLPLTSGPPASAGNRVERPGTREPLFRTRRPLAALSLHKFNVYCVLTRTRSPEGYSKPGARPCICGGLLMSPGRAGNEAEACDPR